MLIRFRLMIAPLLWTLLYGCSDAPRQYPVGTPPNSPIDSSFGFDSQDALGTKPNPGASPEKISNRDEAEITRINTEKPIVYGVGAAGVTLKTSFKEGSQILSKLYGAPEDYPESVEYDYREGIRVFWKKSAPRYPEFISVEPEYGGILAVDLQDIELRTLKMGQSLASFFNLNDKKDRGDALIRSLYNALEKPEPGFDCLKNQVCHIEITSSFIKFYLPKAEFLITPDERRTLYRIIIELKTSHGYLDQNLDLLSGRFAGPLALGLGTPWKEFQKVTADFEVTSSRYPGFFDFDFGGLSLEIIRGLSSSTRSPSPSDIVNGIDISSEFAPNLFLLDTNAIEITGSDLSLVSKDQITPTGNYLRMNVAIEPSAQKRFLSNLLELLKTELKKSNPDSNILVVKSGYNEEKSQKIFKFILIASEPAKNSAFSVQYNFDSETGNFSRFYLRQYDNPIDLRVIQSASEVMKLGTSADGKQKAIFAGFQLGQQVRINQFNPVNEEATLEFGTDSAKVGFKGRYELFERALSNPDHVTFTKMSEYVAHVGYLDTRLGLLPAHGGIGNQGAFVINSVTTRYPAQGVTGFCNDPSLRFYPGQPYKDVKLSLENAFAKNGHSCFITRFHSGYSGHISEIAFPDDKVALLFRNNELSDFVYYSQKGSAQ